MTYDLFIEGGSQKSTRYHIGYSIQKQLALQVCDSVCSVFLMLFSPSVDQKKLLALEGGAKSLLPKPAQSGLRPPGFSHLPPARLAAFGFVRSASVSSVSSNQSNDSTHSSPCRSTSRESCHANFLSRCCAHVKDRNRSTYLKKYS